MAKILIAEDSFELTEVYENIFTKLKMTVTNVSSREKLTRQLVLNKPDIILLNVLLNGEDGRKVCKEIKLNKEFRNLPIILISNSIETLATYKDYLANDYLQKPFNIEHWCRKIINLLELGSNIFDDKGFSMLLNKSNDKTD